MKTFRLAERNDLPELQEMFKKIIEYMNQNKIQIWDEVYPTAFFGEDIEKRQLYVLTQNHEIISAFVLYSPEREETDVQWTKAHQQALYIERFGVNINHLHQGIGTEMLHRALVLAKEKGAKYLRLLVVDINEPAINLYQKAGFKQVDGIHQEVIDKDFMLYEYGFEKEVSSVYFR